MEDFEDIQQEGGTKSDFNLKAELFKYLTHWKWLLLGFLIGGLLAYLYNRYTIPQYFTEASLIITQEENSNVSGILPGGGGASVLKLDNTTLDNQIVTLRSKRLVRKVVDSLEHNISYLKEGSVITTETYRNSSAYLNFISPDTLVNVSELEFQIIPNGNSEFVLQNDEGFSKKYKLDETVEYGGLQFQVKPRNSINDFQKSGPLYIVLSPIDQIVSKYISELAIAQKGAAKDILSLSMIYSESDKAEDFLNELMFQFNMDGVRDKREVAESTTSFIRERLNIIETELDSVEGGIAAFKRDNKFMDVGAGAMEYKSKSITAEQEVFKLETQLELIRLVENNLRSMEGYQLLPADLGISESGVSTMIQNFNNLVQQRNSYLRNSTEENPVVESITDRIEDMENNILDNIVSTKRSIEVQINELNSREQSAEGQFSTFPGLEKVSRNKLRQQEIKEQLYLFLLQRREEAAITFASTSPVARVIDPAFTYDEPVDPKPWLILVGGFLIGLLIPALVIFVKNFLDTKIHHTGDLSPLTNNTPFIGEVPRIKEGQEEVINNNDRSPLAESFRILRTNLAYLIQNKKKEDGAHIIYVTSTVKGEGKTFVSYNLARTLASTNKKVLLIGADIRNPKLHRYADTDRQVKEHGLSDYLYNYEVTYDAVISKSLNKDISVDTILSGPIPPNPAELLMNERLGRLLSEVKPLYDYVIVDTAPTMIVTDTLLISQMADYTIYVTRADYTEKNLLQFPKDLKQQGKLKGLAIVLNDVDYSKFAYGAKYGYSYGYGYGYGEDKTSRWQRVKNRISGGS